MSKGPILRALLSERLSAAAEEIFALVETTIAEYEEELRRSREENQRNQRNPRLRSPRVRSTGVQTEEAYESPSENSNCSSRFTHSVFTAPQTPSEEVQTEGEEEEPEDEGGAEETQADLHLDTDEPNENYDVTESPFSCLAQEMDTKVEEEPKQTAVNEESSEQISSAVPRPKLRKRRRRSSAALTSLKRKSKHQCSVCSKVLKGPQSNLLRHMVIHTGERPFSCSVCEKTFTQQYLFKKHMQSHQEEEEQSPTEQARGTQTGAEEQEAKFNKTESEDCGGAQHLETFRCSVCEKSFKRQVALKKHLESHGKAQVRRPRRDAQTEGESDQAEPQSEVNEQEDEAPAIASVNGEDYTQATLMKTMHAASATATDHRCSVCHRAFTTKTRLKRHMIVHTGDKPFSCPVCNKCFSQKYNVRLHMAVHTDEKPFTCEICLKSYRRNDDLRTHMATHTGQVLFSCMVCNTGFKQRNCLVSHMRLHTGDRPYRCPMCTKTFIQKSNLNRHVRSHTGEKPFRCPVCPQRFVQKSDIRKHMAIHT